MARNSRLRLLDILILLSVVGILACIALPAYHANMNRAKAYEAEMTLEITQHVLLNYYHQKGHFPIETVPIQLTTLKELNFEFSELNGQFYSASDYYYISDSLGNSFKIKAIGSKPGMKMINREIDDVGNLCSIVSF
jgi:Tfp pilus assembly protein PilE